MTTPISAVLAIARGGIPALILEGGLLPCPDFQKKMGWQSSRTVDRSIASGRVFYLMHGSERYFPWFFADQTYNRRHVVEVTRALGSLPGGSKLQFFLMPKGSLGGICPLEALTTGRISKVVDVAHAFAET